jgi:predicted ester cyclase
MTTNKDPGFIARKMVELVDRQDWVATTELVAPNARAYIGSQIFDREGWRGMGQMFYAAFPDARHEVHAVHVAGEYATLLARFTGTHKGDFMGIPATGKQVSFSVIHVDRVVDGRVLEHRGEFDTAGLLQQLAPAPALDRATVETLFDRIDSGKPETVFELMTPDMTFSLGGQKLDRAGWAGFSTMFFAAFPDGKHVHDEIVIAGDRATVVGNFIGTHTGAFQGMPATGKKIKLGYVGIGRFVGGKVASMRVEIDAMGMMQQLTAP